MNTTHPYDLPDPETDQREAHALELATHIRRHPARHISLRERVRNLSRVSDAELDRLVPEVDFFLGLGEWQDTKVKP
jgi:hypothetical protein